MVSSKSMRSVANFTTASRLHSVASRLSLPLGPSVRTGYLTSIGTSTANGDEEGSRTEVSNSKQRRMAQRAHRRAHGRAQASTGEHRRARASTRWFDASLRKGFYGSILRHSFSSSLPPFRPFSSFRLSSCPLAAFRSRFQLFSFPSPFTPFPFQLGVRRRSAVFPGSRTGFFVRTRCTATSPTARRERTTRSREAKRSRCCGQHLAISDNQLSPLSKNT